MLWAERVSHYPINACNYASSVGIGTEASTCRDDGTTDGISDNEQSFPPSRESQVVEIIEHEKDTYRKAIL